LVSPHTQNPFEVNLTIVGVKIQHDYKWGCDNSISRHYNLVKKKCMGLSQTSGSWYGVVITAYGVITTPFIAMPDFNSNNSQIYSNGFLV
jgi:hypothetical protein